MPCGTTVFRPSLPPRSWTTTRIRSLGFAGPGGAGRAAEEAGDRRRPHRDQGARGQRGLQKVGGGRRMGGSSRSWCIPSSGDGSARSGQLVLGEVAGLRRDRVAQGGLAIGAWRSRPSGSSPSRPGSSASWDAAGRAGTRRLASGWRNRARGQLRRVEPAARPPRRRPPSRARTRLARASSVVELIQAAPPFPAGHAGRRVAGSGPSGRTPRASAAAATVGLSDLQRPDRAHRELDRALDPPPADRRVEEEVRAEDHRDRHPDLGSPTRGTPGPAGASSASDGACDSLTKYAEQLAAENSAQAG